MITTIFEFLKTVPAWVWIVLVAIALLFFADRNGYNRRANQDAMRDSAMVHHADTIWIAYSLELPKPPKPKPIQGTNVQMSDSVRMALDTLKNSNISCEQKVAQYDSILTYRSFSFDVLYSDSVQESYWQIDPVKRIGIPFISYRNQNIKIPQITQTLTPRLIPFYQSGIAKVVYGVIGAGCLYEAIRTENLYLGSIGTSILIIGVTL